MLRRLTAAALLALALGAPPAAAQDCTGPAPDAEPGTPAWERREAANVACGNQRSADLAANPAYRVALAQQLAGPSAFELQDALRAPERHAPARFRFDRLSFTGHEGAVRDGTVLRPPASVPGPYPVVVVVHGGAAQQEMYHWATQPLAEAGYLVLTFQLPTDGDTHTEDLRTALDHVLSPAFRFAADVDRSRVGVAGHSAGGVAVSRVGQEDPRVGAIVSWDRAQSTVLPEGLRLRTPALYLTADFNCQRVPVCLPVRYADRPDPKGPGTKDVDFVRTAAAGVDTMKLALRAATHLDWSVVPEGVGSRHASAVSAYATLAWFDWHLRREPAARARLTAPRFDASADRHAIGGGTYDPATGRNVPVLLDGLAVRDRLSFHFRSAWSLDGGRRVCEDVRAGDCDPSPAAAAPPAGPARACRSRRVLDVTLPRPRRGDRVVRATLRVAGGRARAVRVRPGRRVRVELTGRPRATVAVVLRATTREGRVLVARRAFRTCA